MPREPRFLTGIGNAPRRQGDQRVGSALADGRASARLLSARRPPNLERPRLASFFQAPVRRKSTATAAFRSSYDFPDPPAIGFVWQNGSPRRHEGARRSAAVCAERSQSWGHGSEAGAAMQNEANWTVVSSSKCEVGSAKRQGRGEYVKRSQFGGRRI